MKLSDSDFDRNEWIIPPPPHPQPPPPYRPVVYTFNGLRYMIGVSCHDTWACTQETMFDLSCWTQFGRGHMAFAGQGSV